MNEIIVWDEQFKKFIEPCREVVITTDGTGIKGIKGGLGFVEAWKAFQYTGKTDDTPNKNKIYANCSIIEFEYLFEEGWTKMRGIIKYDTDDMSNYFYAREMVGSDKNYYKITFQSARFMDIKVVGTVQQNPELLGVKQC